MALCVCVFEGESKGVISGPGAVLALLCDTPLCCETAVCLAVGNRVEKRRKVKRHYCRMISDAHGPGDSSGQERQSGPVQPVGDKMLSYASYCRPPPPPPPPLRADLTAAPRELASTLPANPDALQRFRRGGRVSFQPLRQQHISGPGPHARARHVSQEATVVFCKSSQAQLGLNDVDC